MQIIASVFFGRTRAVGEVLNELRKQAQNKQPFLMILGYEWQPVNPHWHGAGIVPLMTQAGVIEGIAHWRSAIVRVGSLFDDNGQFHQALGQAFMQHLGLPAAALTAFQHALKQADEAQIHALIKQTLEQIAKAKNSSADKVHLLLLLDSI